MTNSIPWTPQQLKVFDMVENTTQPLMVTSVAGSGKTTTLTHLARLLSGSVLAVAFNVDTKKKMEVIIGDFATCKTMNGLGHGSLMKFLGRKVSLDKNKLFKLTKDELAFKENKGLQELFSPVLKLVARAKAHGLVPDKTPGQYKSLTPDTWEGWAEIANHYDIFFDDDVHRIAQAVLRASNRALFAGTADFDDQIYIPALFGAPMNKFQNVIVDEAQDLSEIQHCLIKKALKKGGRLIAVGDENQAIYGFRAAMSNSIDKLTDEFDLTPVELTISFRCAQNIVQEAQNVVPRIQSSPSAPMGSVDSLTYYRAETFNYGDVILCRNNAPVIKMAYRLILSNIGVHVLGRDIGTGLKLLVTKLVGKNSREVDVIDLLERITDWQTGEKAKAQAKKRLDQIERIQDRADSLFAIIDGSGAKNVGDTLDAIEDLFSKTSGKVTLSSIHRSKGLEWKRVFFLNSDLIPSKWTLKAYEKDPETYEWMMQEESNLRYVAITRAKESLFYINSEGWQR